MVLEVLGQRCGGGKTHGAVAHREKEGLEIKEEDGKNEEISMAMKSESRE